jgi:hypothetical protein
MRVISILCLSALCASGLLLHHPANFSSESNEQKSAAAQVKIQQKQPRMEDVSSIDGMIKAYFEVVSGPAGQPRDWGRDATLYIPGVRFVMISKGKNGKTTAQSMSHQEFVDAGDASMVEKGFYEHEIHRITHRAGDVAHVISTAEQALTSNGPSQGRSIDSLDLYWDGSRWWIASATIWEVGPGESLPSEFLPK